jgi:hypothetical protein
MPKFLGPGMPLSKVGRSALQRLPHISLQDAQKKAGRTTQFEDWAVATNQVMDTLIFPAAASGKISVINLGPWLRCRRIGHCGVTPPGPNRHRGDEVTRYICHPLDKAQTTGANAES